ncbi:MAG: molybdopterin-dependent oxidoreductase [Clostridia bacterium]|nr:molybdopterin-dependent oxidoreductase [Clostridia bacterium]
MKNNLKKTLTGVTSAAMLLSGSACQAVESAQVTEQTDLFSAAQDATISYKAVANVQGEFSFNQDELTPSDEAFNIFGTAMTGLCAKPAFVLENSKEDYFVNVGGKIKKSYSVNLTQMQPRERVMLCACATGPAVANIKATGVSVEDILQLADIEDDVNAISFIGSDGYERKLPLSYVLEKKALIAYRVNDESIPMGTQLYIPETVARYFTRDIVDIELGCEDDLPGIDSRDEELKAQIALRNFVEGSIFAPGSHITFEGYADDCGDPIAAVEFSMDGGQTWNTCETPGATADRWVYWRFATTIGEEGVYQITARARTASGNVSPLAATATFEVSGQSPSGTASI